MGGGVGFGVGHAALGVGHGRVGHGVGYGVGGGGGGVGTVPSHSLKPARVKEPSELKVKAVVPLTASAAGNALYSLSSPQYFKGSRPGSRVASVST